jgi:hypothetical protein
LGSLGQIGKVKFFLFNFCLLSFFNYPCFWEKVVDNVFLFFVQEYLDTIHLIILLHITFHLHNCIVYFLSTLHFIFLSIACKCLG